MLSQRIICLSLFVAAAADSSGGSNALLRGSVAAPAGVPAVFSSEANEDVLQHLQCSCDDAGSCACTSSSIGAPGHEEDAELQQALLNQTQELHAWWAANGGHDGQMSCSCAMGDDACQCEHNSTTLEAPLLNETEQPLSLWWAGGGGFHRGWGWRRGWRGCRRVRYGGCGCRWHGCRCGAVRGGGCWR